MIYLPISLNNIYCAPNKIWEYSRFGLAMVGNDIPGLLFLNQLNIGCTLNLNNMLDVDIKMNYLVNYYQTMKHESLKFYHSLDMKKRLCDILMYFKE